MTETLLNDTIDENKTAPEAEKQLSTREILEQNWDRLVENKTADVSFDTSVPSGEAEPISEMKDTPESSDFNLTDFIEKGYQNLKQKTNKNLPASKEEWIKSLIKLDEIFHTEPQKALSLLKQQTLEQLRQSPEWGQKQQQLNDKLLSYVLKDMFLGKKQPPVKMPMYPLQSVPLQGQVPAFSPSLAPFLPPQMPMYGGQMTQGQGSERPAFQTPSAPSGLSPNAIKDMIKQELETYVKESRLATQKAQEASFAPQTTAVAVPASKTHTASGRLKTTREILEDGWRQFIGD